MRAVFLSTSDNPFSPVDQYDDWEVYDRDYGYFCNCYLARVAMTSDYLPDEENDLEIERAIDSIVEFQIPMINKNGDEVRYIKVVGEVPDVPNDVPLDDEDVDLTK